MVDRLIYLSHTRLDIAFAVSLISQFMHCSTEDHMQDVRRILCYLKTTPGKGILFKAGTNLDITGYTGADYEGSLVDKRSTIDYCVFLGENLVFCDQVLESNFRH